MRRSIWSVKITDPNFEEQPRKCFLAWNEKLSMLGWFQAPKWQNICFSATKQILGTKNLSTKNGNHLKAIENFKYVCFWVRETECDTESSNALTWTVCNEIKRSGIRKFRKWGFQMMNLCYYMAGIFDFILM